MDLIVRDDLERLGQRIHLPQGTVSATWTVLPVGHAGSTVPGPTDTRLYALLQITPEGWQHLGASAEAARHRDVSLPAAVGAALLPQALASEPAASSALGGGTLRIGGAEHDARLFERGAYRGIFAIRTGDAMLVCLQTQ